MEGGDMLQTCVGELLTLQSTDNVEYRGVDTGIGARRVCIHSWGSIC